MKLTFMTYNIYNGAETTIDDVIAVINEVKPDILTLNEANGFENDTRKRLAYVSEQTAMPYTHLALCGDGSWYHTALLSKYPILDATLLYPCSRSLLVSRIQVDNHVFSIGSLHLSPRCEADRLQEVHRLINHIGENSTHTAVMGDCNSLSFYDTYPPDMVDSFDANLTRKFTRDGTIVHDVTRFMAQAGLVDTAAALQQHATSTAPTPLPPHPDHPTSRLDYIFVSKDLQPALTSYNVVKTPPSDRASDHYPVVVELTL